MAKKNFYVVLIGRKTGIYSTWSECEKEVKGYPGAKFRAFSTIEQVEEYIDQHFQDNLSQ